MKRRQHSLYINRQTRKSAEYESPYYTFRNAFDYEAARTQRQNHEMPHHRVAEVAEFVESRTASMVATESIFAGHSAISKSTPARTDSDLEAAAIRSSDQIPPT